MLSNVNDARDTIERYNVSFISTASNALCKNKDAFNLCAFYLAQFGEKVKLLTDQSKAELSKVVNLDILKYFRNIIDHDYENVNKEITVSKLPMAKAFGLTPR